jgi:hypothetical protein
MRKQILGIWTLLALIASHAIAKPNFAGYWTLTGVWSSLISLPEPDNSTRYQITDSNPNLKIVETFFGDGTDKFEEQVNYTTDGNQIVHRNDALGNGFFLFCKTLKSTANWHGNTLVIKTTGRWGRINFSMTQRWTLSADGRVLTVWRTFKPVPYGEPSFRSMKRGTQRLTFGKQQTN